MTTLSQRKSWPVLLVPPLTVSYALRTVCSDVFTCIKSNTLFIGLVESKGLDFVDREKAKRHATQEAEKLYKERTGYTGGF